MAPAWRAIASESNGGEIRNNTFASIAVYIIAASGLGNAAASSRGDETILAAATNDSILKEAIGVGEVEAPVGVARVGGGVQVTGAILLVVSVARSTLGARSVDGARCNVALLATAFEVVRIRDRIASDGVGAARVGIASSVGVALIVENTFEQIRAFTEDLFESLLAPSAGTADRAGRTGNHNAGIGKHTGAHGS